MIQSFSDKRTEKVWRRERTRFSTDVQRAALRRLSALHAAERLDDLRVPPGNQLEQLRGDRSGQHSIRINRRWRICFHWTNTGPEEVEICDYH